MGRRHVALWCGLAALAIPAVACSSSGTDSSEATTTVEQKTSSTATINGPTPVPSVTRPENATKVDRSELPPKAQAARYGGIGTDESDCIDAVIVKTVEEDPSVAADDAVLAGATGAAIVACVPQEKLGDLIAADLAGTATAEQVECVKQQVVTADPQSLAVFLGGLAIDDRAVVASVAQSLDGACGTTLASA